MKIGVFGTIMPTSVAVTDVARELESRNFDSMFVGEHHHLPTSTKHPHYDPLPEVYWYAPDPFLVLSAAAAVTKNLRIGTTISLTPIHDPIVLASQIGTMDMISNGRLIYGMGVGWNKVELENHGVEFSTRMERTREYVLLMKKLWGQEKTSFDGEFVKVQESWQGPKPIQKPHPPLLFGGSARKKTFQYIAEFCDGWIPTSAYVLAGDRLDVELVNLNHAVEEAGRDPKSLQNLMLMEETGSYDYDPEEFAKRCPTREDFERFEKLGFARVAVGVPFFQRTGFLGALDCLSKVVEPWVG